MGKNAQRRKSAKLKNKLREDLTLINKLSGNGGTNVYRGADGCWKQWIPERVAIHESGHTVVAHALNLEVGKVFIRGSDDAALDNHQAAGESLSRNSRYPEDNIVVAFAGVCAETLLLDKRSPNDDDFSHPAFRHDEKRIQVWIPLLPLDRTLPIDEPTDRAIATALDRAKNLVLNNERNIRRMSRLLLRDKQLDADAIVALLGPRTCDNSITDDRIRELWEENTQHLIPFRVEIPPAHAKAEITNTGSADAA
jgi:hypothetical protein